jgi:hypothetical protein
MIKTRVGKIVKVKNQGKKAGANETYQAVILNITIHFCLQMQRLRLLMKEVARILKTK